MTIYSLVLNSLKEINEIPQKITEIPPTMKIKERRIIFSDRSWGPGFCINGAKVPE